MLYEMIAGAVRSTARRPPIIGAIVSSDPPALPTLASGVPAGVERVIRGCLDKDPEARWQDIRDVRGALEAASGHATTAAAPSSRSRAGWLTAAATAMLLLLAGAAMTMKGTRAVPADLVRFDFNLPAPAEIQRFADTNPYFAVSPDGSRIVMVASGGSPTSSLWIKATMLRRRPFSRHGGRERSVAGRTVGGFSPGCS